MFTGKVKLVAYGIATLMVIALVGFGVKYVVDLRANNIALKADLKAEKVKSAVAESSLTEAHRQHADSIRNMEQLEIARTRTEADIAVLRETIEELEESNDPQTVARAVRARNAELNRLLERRTGKDPGGAGAGASAGKAGAPGAAAPVR